VHGDQVVVPVTDIVHGDQVVVPVTDIVHGDQVVVPVTNYREFLCTQHNVSGYVENTS
jgi:hypothetical protein